MLSGTEILLSGSKVAGLERLTAAPLSMPDRCPTKDALLMTSDVTASDRKGAKLVGTSSTPPMLKLPPTPGTVQLDKQNASKMLVRLEMTYPFMRLRKQVEQVYVKAHQLGLHEMLDRFNAACEVAESPFQFDCTKGMSSRCREQYKMNVT